MGKGISKTIVSKDGTASFVKVNRIIPKGPKSLMKQEVLLFQIIKNTLRMRKLKS